MNLEQLRNKKVAIAMSSSFFGFFAHAGFLNALELAGITPYAYSGTSAGALNAALSASGMCNKEIYSHLMALEKEAFWDPDYKTLTKSAFSLLKGWTGLLKGNSFRKLISSHLPVHTFEECKSACCIVATNITDKKKKVFTKGNLIAAIHASVAVPGLFEAVRIRGKYYVDGGLIVKTPVLDLYNLVKPDVIIVHYLRSNTLGNSENSFLGKSFTTHKISALTGDICRHLEYELECQHVKNLGCNIIELSPQVIKVSPNDLKSGETAFQQAEQFAKDFLANIE